jgi:hypothetical protein
MMVPLPPRAISENRSGPSRAAEHRIQLAHAESKRFTDAVVAVVHSGDIAGHDDAGDVDHDAARVHDVPSYVPRDCDLPRRRAVAMTEADDAMGMQSAPARAPAPAPSRGTPARRYPVRTVLWLVGMSAFLAFMLSGIVRCPTAGLFHVPCPACGSTRTALALVHFDFAGVMRFNPIALLVIPCLAGIAWRTLALVYTDGHAKRLDEEKLGRFFLVSLVYATMIEFAVWGLRFAGFLGGPCPL